ncbi:MAG: tRNA (adenosine(37)-N6)-threonylcarbamoyltransferase complex transferase subunit TsaD [SAR324 cluster bacterium]|nr:tRNA (adenosine(37)-N6)-threonylcarbamoyltransferase complex transferase subunit TsaD [SAR324 cluster bacterium]
MSATAKSTGNRTGNLPAGGPLGLAIDTTFDDTSVAILRGRREVLANLTLSQYADHAEFGGVVPERASRRHLEVIQRLIGDALAKAGEESHGGASGDDAGGDSGGASGGAAPVSLAALDYVAVSNLPGLMGSILVGMTVAKSLSYLLEVPLIGINHIEAHPYANVIAHGEPAFPLIHLVAAGGHTLLIHQRGHFDWEIVGRSVDDAAGECVDKVAKMFGHPMPGGPVVDRLAMTHQPGPYRFPRPMLNAPGLDFSFSGLKTAMLYLLRKEGLLEEVAGENRRPGNVRVKASTEQGPLLAAFFAAVCDVLVAKTLRAARQFGVETVTLSGGLAASAKLRERFGQACAEAGLRLLVPPPELCTDNAAMVGCLAAFRYEAGRLDDLSLEGYPNLPM